ncbi:MAG: hypothetical protein JRI79_07610 [Deltaproteobacteria bacterium]|nr:hypothetical protein [Deltaproteobacteria bacterium]MBW2301064.1 hypothetical protein [Deltaproteobacteria bacterium]
MVKSFDDFKNLLADLFGQPLNQEAEVAAEDFWKNVTVIAEGVSQGNIAINVDILSLSLAFPEYKTYQVWKGLAIFVFLVALPVLFFSWKISLGILVASIIIYSIGNAKRRAAGRRFVSDIQASIAAGDMAKGLGKLCAHYIAGHLQLASVTGRAHWPQIPSDVLTGQRTLIQV